MKSQVAMDFLFLVVLGFMMLIVFSFVAREQLVDTTQKKEYVLLKDACMMVQTEINSAINLEDGYRRRFFIPEKLDNVFEYDMRIEGSYVVGNTSYTEYILKIQPVNGNLKKGNNTLLKTGGVLNLN